MAKEFDIGKPAETCVGCGKELAPGEEIIATVRETDEELIREDYCLACRTVEPAGENADLLGVWRSRIPRPEEKKKLLVDDALITNFFERLAGTESEAKRTYRFVLALVLMRKKLLVYDRTRKDDDGQDVWLMHFKGDDTVHEVLDPHMDELKIAEVSHQLGEIMQGELS